MQQRPVRIYSSADVPRLRYIAGILLGDILGLSWEIITDKRKLRKHTVINYSSESIDGSFQIHPQKLLFEKGIIEREIPVSSWNDLPILFPSSESSDLPFDIFAASFYLVTRYEEYQKFIPDQHGRFSPSSSIAFRNGFLGLPVVDLWARGMARAILKKYPTIAFRRNKFRSLLTIDTDQAFAYNTGSIFSSIRGFIYDIAGTLQKSSEKDSMILQEEKDPYDVFDYIKGKISEYNQDSRFFFPVGDHSSYDLNPSWRNPEYRNLITAISKMYQAGIHPSYHSSERISVFLNEIDRLSSITGTKIEINRFHYLRFLIPESYRKLVSAGIKEDYSMGYADEPGFRSGIARPTQFYDVEKDEVTDLKIIPFQFMDETISGYKNADSESAREVINKLIEECRRAGGVFVSIWHNTSLTEERKGWRDVFEFMLKDQNNDYIS
jgi:hypothetical protein